MLGCFVHQCWVYMAKSRTNAIIYFPNFDVFAMFCSEILCTLVHWMLEVAGLGGMASSVVHFFTLHFFYTYFALFLHFEILVDLMFKVFGGTASSEDE